MIYVTLFISLPIKYSYAMIIRIYYYYMAFVLINQKCGYRFDNYQMDYLMDFSLFSTNYLQLD